MGNGSLGLGNVETDVETLAIRAVERMKRWDFGNHAPTLGKLHELMARAIAI